MTPLAARTTAALEDAGLRLYVRTQPTARRSPFRRDDWRVHEGNYADGRQMVAVRIGNDATADDLAAVLEGAGLTVDRGPERYGYVRATEGPR